MQVTKKNKITAKKQEKIVVDINMKKSNTTI